MKIRKWWIEKGIRIAGEREEKKGRRKKRRRAAERGSRVKRRLERRSSSGATTRVTHKNQVERSKLVHWPNRPDPRLREAVCAWPSRVQLVIGVLSRA